jgi:hypothetical protein
LLCINNDLNTHEKITADSKGHYTIRAGLGDTLIFSFVGVSSEKRIVQNIGHINVLLIDKTVNDLGAVWTKSNTDRRTDRQTDIIKGLLRKRKS